MVGTWLALGGGGGHDARFDPVTGRGNPGPTTSVARHNVAALADDDVVDTHPLWPVRVARASRPGADAAAALEDPSPDARRQLARLASLGLDECTTMLADADRAVRNTARRRMTQRSRTRPAGRTLTPRASASPKATHR